jgi:hypothetical protein
MAISTIYGQFCTLGSVTTGLDTAGSQHQNEHKGEY